MHDSYRRLAIRIVFLAIAGLTWMVYTGLNEQFLHPINYTGALLRLPFTSREFVLGVYAKIHEHPIIEKFLKWVYVFGYISTFTLAAAYFAARRDWGKLDTVIMGYFTLQTIAGIIYAFAFVYPPHIVYGVNPIDSPMLNLSSNRFVLPSLHTAITVFLFLVFLREKTPVKWYFILMGILVPITTVLLVQHWIYDVITGIALALIGYKISISAAPGLTRMIEHMEIDGKTALRWAATFTAVALTFAVLKMYAPASGKAVETAFSILKITS